MPVITPIPKSAFIVTISWDWRRFGQRFQGYRGHG